MPHHLTEYMVEENRRSESYLCLSPVDGRPFAERPLATDRDVERSLSAARTATRMWSVTSLEDRMAACTRFVDAFGARRDAIAEEITWQMGRPIGQTPSEIRGVEERARSMIGLAPEALKDFWPDPRNGITRFIRREPLGVVLVMAPWNYPYLTAVNAVIAAILAGNAVMLKHSEQTFLCAERFAEAFDSAGLPKGVFQVLHLSHEQSAGLITMDEGPDLVCFTGSVEGGSAVQRAAAARSDRFIGVGLELGGKDAAYVRCDADVDAAVANLVDGAFFNAGQSCCGIERLYVHADVYDHFLDKFVETTQELRLGNPIERATTLGPLVRTRSADFVREQIAEAVHRGAHALVDSTAFPFDAVGTPYMAPQVLTDVDHSMRVMTEETFGPVVGIMKVRTDDEAVALMNDSAYGLTASVWTSDENAALELGERLEVGTVFMNRCDYLDPELAWTGVKASGRGVTLSRFGFDQVTRPKSFHLRVHAS